MGRSFEVFISRINEDVANIEIDSSFEAGSRRYRLQWKDIAEYVTSQQTSDREERAAWRDAQKMKEQAEEKKRADELRMAEIESR